MTREQYTAQRAALMAEAKKCIDESRLDDFAAAKEKVETLDRQFADEAAAAANYAALEGGSMLAQAAIGVITDGGRIPAEPKADGDLYRTAFLKRMMNSVLTAEESAEFDRMNRDRMTNAVVTSGSHSAVIPETMAAKIWTEMQELHPIIADALPGTTYITGFVSIPVGTDSNDAAWYDDATTTAQQTNANFTTTSVDLSGYDLAKCVTVSWNLLTMSIDDFEVYLRAKIAEKMSAAFANALVNGLGVPGQSDSFKAQPLGAVTAINAETNTPQKATYTAASGMAYSDLTGLMAKLRSGYASGAVFYAKNAVIWNSLANICDDNGRPIFIPDVTADGVGRIFGCKVKEESSVADGSVLLGNYAKAYALNINRDMGVVTEEHAKDRNTDFVGYMIVDGKPLTTKGYAYLTPAAVEGGGSNVT